MEAKWTIDLEDLFRTGLSLNQYYTLYCTCYKQYDLLEKYSNINGPIRLQDLHSLQNKGLITFNEPVVSYDDIRPTDQAYKILGFTKEDQWFEELWNVFPRRTPKGRVLKQIGHQKAKKKYFSRIKSESDHRKILAALDRELKHRAATGNIDYMQSLETWLNNESWNAFPEEDTPKLSFGNEIE